MPVKNATTGSHYGLLRLLLGLYLFVHFAQLVPWGPELFSSRGVLPIASSSPLAHLPNLLVVWDSAAVVTGVLLAAAGASLAFAFGFHDRIAAGALWYVWACLLGRNPLILNPAIPYVGWMLLAHACGSRGVSGSGNGARGCETGRVPREVYVVAWILLSLGYTYSGLTKLASRSWRDGTAVERILETPLARPGPVRNALLSLSEGSLKLATWGALGLELFFAPLALVPHCRRWIWSLMLAMHLVLMVLIDFVDLSLGMVMFHLLTFDTDWLPDIKFASQDARVALLPRPGTSSP